MIEVRCPKCGKLLFKADGTGPQISIKCDRCKVVVRWPSEQAEIINDRRRPNKVGPEEVKKVN